MKKFAYLLLLLLLPIVCTGQYRYEISIESFNGVSPKKAYSQICKKIEFTNRKVVGDNLLFESKNSYPQDKMEHIVELAGYELSLFRKSLIEANSNTNKK